jgi:hypothetical protein
MGRRPHRPSRRAFGPRRGLVQFRVDSVADARRRHNRKESV